MKRILAIANQKGGVGKTTTDVNLAASLAAAERRMLVVDMDPQANAVSGSGFRRAPRRRHLRSARRRRAPVRELTQLTELRYLWLVPSTRDLAGAEVELVDVERREFRLRDALAPSRQPTYDYVSSTARRRWAC